MVYSNQSCSASEEGVSSRICGGQLCAHAILTFILPDYQKYHEMIGTPVQRKTQALADGIISLHPQTA